MNTARTSRNFLVAAFVSTGLLLALVQMGAAQPLVPPDSPAPELGLRQDLITTATVKELEPSITPTSRIELFNGKNFDGWTVFSRSNTSSAGIWSVTNGLIHCMGKPIGYLRTEKNFRDYKLTVE